jgi:hypothetical protein
MPFELTSDQRMFINIYARQYSQVQEQMARLQDQINRLIPISNEIRNNINTIYADASREENRRRQHAHQPPPLMEEQPSYTMTYTFMDEPSLSQQANTYSDLMTSETTPRIFSDIEIPLNTECPIRLEPFEANSSVVQINRCGHIFYPSGLQHWFDTNSRCPVCRTELRPQSQQQQQQPSQNSEQLLSTLLYDIFFPSTADTSNNVLSRRTRRNAR